MTDTEKKDISAGEAEKKVADNQDTAKEAHQGAAEAHVDAAEEHIEVAKKHRDQEQAV